MQWRASMEKDLTKRRRTDAPRYEECTSDEHQCDEYSTDEGVDTETDSEYGQEVAKGGNGTTSGTTTSVTGKMGIEAPGKYMPVFMSTGVASYNGANGTMEAVIGATAS